MGNLCVSSDDSDSYYKIDSNELVNKMENHIHQLKEGIDNLKKDIINLETENSRLKTVNQTLLSKVVESN